jgi:hypothetical protein
MRHIFYYFESHYAVEGNMKVVKKTFIELNGTCVSLGDLRNALLEYGDSKLLKVVLAADDRGFDAVRIEIS